MSPGALGGVGRPVVLFLGVAGRSYLSPPPALPPPRSRRCVVEASGGERARVKEATTKVAETL